MDKLRILIVDDVAQVRQDLSTILSLSHDLEVVGQADNGIEAVALAETLMPDVVLMDLEMPGLDGFEATQQIKERQLARRVVVLTIHGHDDYREKAAQVGADAFIEKGTDIEALLRSLRTRH
jgi:DNA-binding NarL/FixJ family response regulator